MKKFFITGVNGFIGRNLCKFLIDKKFIVYGIDNFFSSNRNDLKELKAPNFHFEKNLFLIIIFTTLFKIGLILSFI